jgi:DNA polymerase-3 subunit gamma/tau
VEAIIANQPAEGLDTLHRTLDAGSDPRQFARQIVDYLRGLLLVAMGNAGQVDATAEVRAQMARHSQALPVAELLRLIQAFNQAASEGRSGWQPALPLEMAFVEALTPPAPAAPAAPVSAAPVHVAAQPTKRAAAARPASTMPTAAPAEQPPAEALAPEDASANQRLEESWDRLLAAVRHANSQLYGLLNSSRAHLMKGSVLILGYPSDILKTQMEKPHNLEVIQAAVKEVLGLEVTVRCFIASGKRSTPPPDVDSDGMVAAALRDLGGEIVDVQ